MTRPVMVPEGGTGVCAPRTVDNNKPTTSARVKRRTAAIRGPSTGWCSGTLPIALLTDGGDADIADYSERTESARWTSPAIETRGHKCCRVKYLSRSFAAIRSFSRNYRGASRVIQSFSRTMESFAAIRSFSRNYRGASHAIRSFSRTIGKLRRHSKLFPELRRSFARDSELSRTVGDAPPQAVTSLSSRRSSDRAARAALPRWDRDLGSCGRESRRRPSRPAREPST